MAGMVKKIQFTFFVIGSYLLLMVTLACVQEQLPDLYARCPDPVNANLIDFEVFYTPYLNNQYSSSSDTVDFEEFQVVLEFTPERLSNLYRNNFSFPWESMALSCIPQLNLRNISNISVVLTAPFEGLPAGTDISYLLETTSKETLAQFRDFSQIEPVIGLDLKLRPTNFSQLKTRTFVFLKDGTALVKETQSPLLQTS